MTYDFDRAVDHIVEALLTISHPGSLVVGVGDNGDVLLHGPTGGTVRLIESCGGTAMEWNRVSPDGSQSGGGIDIGVFDLHSGILIQDFIRFLGVR